MPKLDTLHTINQVYSAIMHLPVDTISNAEILKELVAIKTKPKTFIEEYGVIIGASLAFLGSLLTFGLGALKDTIVGKRNRKLEDKKIRKEIFAELNEMRETLEEKVKQKDELAQEIRFWEFKFLKEPEGASKLKSKREIENKLTLVEDYEKQFQELKKIFSAKVYNYVFHKEMQTDVIEILKQLRKKGFKYVASKLECENTNESIIAAVEADEKAYNQFFKEKVEVPITEILTCIMKNK